MPCYRIFSHLPLQELTKDFKLSMNLYLNWSFKSSRWIESSYNLCILQILVIKGWIMGLSHTTCIVRKYVKGGKHFEHRWMLHSIALYTNIIKEDVYSNISFLQPKHIVSVLPIFDKETWWGLQWQTTKEFLPH